MNWLDVFVIALIAGYCAYILFSKKKGGCGGCCANCQGCGCHRKKEGGAPDVTEDRQ